MTVYRTIVADPPWEITPTLGRGGRRKNTTRVPYSFMSLPEIRGLRPPADDDCALFLWATRKAFREGWAADVARAWGFEPCGEIVWGLPNAGTGAAPFGNDHEPVLVAEHGDPYCSAVCCRLDHGLDGAETEGRWGKTMCRGCGCAYEDETAGCQVCEMRHSKRRKAAA